MTLWNHITVGRVVCANGSEFVPFGGDMRFRIMILSVSVGRVCMYVHYVKGERMVQVLLIALPLLGKPLCIETKF